MHDPRTLKIFFDQYIPSMKQLIEDYWVDNRAELVEFLEDWLRIGVAGSWMAPYFQDMLHYAKSAPHTYPDPWSVL